jgi:hypothetical protein
MAVLCPLFAGDSTTVKGCTTLFQAFHSQTMPVLLPKSYPYRAPFLLARSKQSRKNSYSPIFAHHCPQEIVPNKKRYYEQAACLTDSLSGIAAERLEVFCVFASFTFGHA